MKQKRSYIPRYTILSDKKKMILFALSEFQYLTALHMVRLGVSPSDNYCRTLALELTRGKKPFIKKIDFVIQGGGGGKKASLYHLTKHGAELLEEIAEDKKIKYPKHFITDFSLQYDHRINCIDFFVSLRLWVVQKGYKLEDFQYYFRQTGTNRNNKGGRSLSENRLDIDKDGVGYIIPDGIFLVHRSETTPVFGVFEQHNGKDTGRIIEQVRRHCVALKYGIPSLRLDVKHNGEYVANRVFICFEQTGCMKATMKRLAQADDFKPFMQFFHFASLEEENPFISNSWMYANGLTVDL